MSLFPYRKCMQGIYFIVLFPGRFKTNLLFFLFQKQYIIPSNSLAFQCVFFIFHKKRSPTLILFCVIKRRVYAAVCTGFSFTVCSHCSFELATPPKARNERNRYVFYNLELREQLEMNVLFPCVGFQHVRMESLYFHLFKTHRHSECEQCTNIRRIYRVSLHFCLLFKVTDTKESGYM